MQAYSHLCLLVGLKRVAFLLGNAENVFCCLRSIFCLFVCLFACFFFLSFFIPVLNNASACAYWAFLKNNFWKKKKRKNKTCFQLSQGLYRFSLLILIRFNSLTDSNLEWLIYILFESCVFYFLNDKFWRFDFTFLSFLWIRPYMLSSSR